MADEVELIKKLSGHSGCKISLIRRNGCLVVRKTSSTEVYNQRLKAQCYKQKDSGRTKFNSPKVIEGGINEKKLYFFDMEYINCYSLGKILPTLSYYEIKGVFKELVAKVDIVEERISDKTNEIVKNKVKRIYDQIKLNEMIQQELLNKAISIIYETDFSKMPLGFCHGDLTLENILISSDKKLYFIDFLDSYVDSGLIDIAKILQDLELYWSYRNMTIDANIELRTLVAKEQVLSELKNSSRNPELIIKYTYLMLLVNVLRIYPYSRTKKDYDYLNKALLKTIKILKMIV